MDHDSIDPLGEQASTVEEEWAACAPALIDWVLGLRVRDDVHGRYRRVGTDAQGEPIIRPYTQYAPLDRETLQYHFSAIWADAICGIHIVSSDERCRSVVIDIDRHTSDGADQKTNRLYAKHLYRTARALGLDCLLCDSDGRGGYHIWIIFARSVPLADAYRLGRWLARDHADHGLVKQPESFPKSPRLTSKRVGSWVRLPGRHPKRDHYTRVWDDDRCIWLEGADAVEAILRVRGCDVGIAAIVPADFWGERPARAARTRASWSGPVHQPRPTLVAGSDRGRSLALAEDALRHLGADYYDDYDNWLAVGMALTALGDDGLRLWRLWSSQSHKYDPVVVEAKWASFAVAADDPERKLLGLGSLFAWAKEAGWTYPGGCPRRGEINISISYNVGESR